MDGASVKTVFCFRQRTAYGVLGSLVGSEMCIGGSLYIMALSTDPEGKFHGLEVGRSANIPQRCSSLAAGLPFTMLVLAVFTGAGEREEAVHTLLAEHRNTNGKAREWFHCTLSDVLHAVGCAMQSRAKVNGGAPATEQ